MQKSIAQVLWAQFGASIDMLHNGIDHCPESLWDTKAAFWYNAYHCIFFLDYYSTLNPINFCPPAPFDLSEFQDRLPSRVYSKKELLDYLQNCRAKCMRCVLSLSDTELFESWTNESKSMQFSYIEIILYNMRHVQHHAAQLNMMLRNGMDDAPSWVFRAEDETIVKTH